MRITKVTYTIFDKGTDLVTESENESGRLQRKSYNKDRMLAVCSVVFDGCLMVHKTTVNHGRGGLYVSTPPQSVTSGKSAHKQGERVKRVYHPLNREFDLYFSNTVLDGYEYCVEHDTNEYIPKGE